MNSWKKRSPYSSPGLRRRSMALVVTLALLLLITIVILAYFSQATLNRQILFASAAQARADNLSQTALQTIVGDLRNEIAAGSTAVTSTNGYPIYIPTNTSVMVPQRVGSTGMTNLIKMSVGGSNVWSGSNFSYSGPVRAITNNSTTNPSANGRYIPLATWEYPQLITPAETNSLHAPDWILITRQGPVANASAMSVTNFSNRNSTNSSYVIGRFAYVIYDIGGLLDANVAGYPSTETNATDIARKGNLAMISLTNIPGIAATNSDALVQWRIGTNSTVTNYADFVRAVAATNGFMLPVPGGEAFLTRQDLIKYATTNGMTNALPYLTSFSRELNSPNWMPSTPVGSTITYASLAETVGATNRDLVNVRGTNGTELIASRFDLNRLTWLTYGGPSADLSPTNPLYNTNGTDANIQKYFGLVWDTNAVDPGSELGLEWIYTSPDGTTTNTSMIKTLDQVTNREPDFFELLKAGMLGGSLGQYTLGEAFSGSSQWTNTLEPYHNADSIAFQMNAAYPGNSTNMLFNQVPDYQVFSIGANILAQYSSNSYPPVIKTSGANVIGSESLPYEFGDGEDTYRTATNTVLFNSPNTNRNYAFTWLKFVIWNPNRNAALVGKTTNAGPTQFRIWPSKGALVSAPGAWGTNADDAPATPSRNFADETETVGFSNSPAFIDPSPLMPSNVISGTAFTYDEVDDSTTGTGGSMNCFTDPNTGRAIAGIYMGKIYGPDYRVNPALSTNWWFDQAQFRPLTNGSAMINTNVSPLVDLRMQYLLADGKTWRSYQIIHNINTLIPRGFDDTDVPPGPEAAPYTNLTAFADIEWANPDPRDKRFGMTTDGTNTDTTVDGVSNTYRISVSQKREETVYVYSGTTGTAKFTSLSRLTPSDYADNLAVSANNYYADMDGVVRPGDANGRGSIPPALYVNATNSRPLMLNAPFHSIGDLGYTFRDLQWKSLDFASTNSADAGLLDLFGLYGGVPYDLPVVAGKVNINSASPTVLQALLSGALVDYTNDLVSVGQTLSTNDVTTLVSALRPSNAITPFFTNKAALVAFFATNMPSAYIIKGQREAPIRALADLVQTRTWNLLIDVVTQAGHYAPGASGVNQFMVEGEKHYWLQIAIDRFTGQIVDEELEPVYEQ